jgi:hypothetical protein
VKQNSFANSVLFTSSIRLYVMVLN